ncbi:uncharacterized protein LOC134290634 [Aedes albopictus]|uniref:Peptidase A2 domain-containing protein n=1 Tax=Aedes albopictus TaxID=7160 RepID=A0ABM1ZXE7_AEDAL
MEVLLKKRLVAFERLKREHASARQVTLETPTFEVNDRLQKLVELQENFDKIQCEIEDAATEEELPSVLNVREDYEKLFYITKGIYARLLETKQPQGSCGGSSDATYIEPETGLKEAVRVLLETQRALLTRQAAASTTVQELADQLRNIRGDPIDTQLPSFSLPTFKGDRKQWASFKDIFISSLQLLMSHLEGEAKSLVSSYAITNINYKEVWDTLVEQYDKPKFAVSALVQEFCDQPVIKIANLVNLRKLVSTSDEVIRHLKAMGAAYESRDPWLIHIVVKKLDENLRSQWASHIVDIDNPTFDELLKFLKRKCDTFETCAAFGSKHWEPVKKEIFKEERKNPTVKKEITSFSVTQPSCPVCSSGDHGIYQCSTFKEASVKERREIAQRMRLCFNCLRSNHCANSCPSRSVCRTSGCQQRHHTLLCPVDKSEVTSNVSTVEDESVTTCDTEDNNELVSCASNVKSSKSTTSIFVATLPTAVVRVQGKDKQFHEVRAMIDSGSQSSLISEHCVTVLGLERDNAKLIVSGVGNGAKETTRGVVNLDISSRFDDNLICRTKAYVLSKLSTNLPSREIDISRLKCLDSLRLADPHFGRPSKIDLILGVDVFLSVVEDGKVKDEMGVPEALNSAFGWIVAGQVGVTNDVICNTAIVSLCTELNIDQTLRQFWEVVEINKPKPRTPEEQKAVDVFQATHHREESGRFVVSLPFDETKPPLGESLPAAIHRLNAIPTFIIEIDSDRHRFLKIAK